MPFFWFASFADIIKRIRDETFCFGIWLVPNPCTWHTSCIHGVGCNSEELRGILYVWIPAFIAQEMSNNRFTIPKLVLPIASKMRVTHYPKVTKKKNKCALTSLKNQTRVLLRAQKTKKRCSYELKMTYISVVSIWGSFLKLLRVVLVFHLHLYLF